MEAGDEHHGRAIAWEKKVVAEHTFLITTEAVMWEMLNYFSAPTVRARAIRLYHACRNRQEVLVEDYRRDLCDAAVRLYENRSDKEWGITDCLSFETMRLRGISQALTADHHFEQVGYEALLLHDPA